MDIQKLINMVAEVYEVEADKVKPETVIREELSNQSMLIIALMSCVEEEFGVAIDLAEAGKLNTVQDVADKIESLLG